MKILTYEFILNQYLKILNFHVFADFLILKHSKYIDHYHCQVKQIYWN